MKVTIGDSEYHYEFGELLLWKISGKKVLCTRLSGEITGCGIEYRRYLDLIMELTFNQMLDVFIFSMRDVTFLGELEPGPILNFFDICIRKKYAIPIFGEVSEKVTTLFEFMGIPSQFSFPDLLSGLNFAIPDNGLCHEDELQQHLLFHQKPFTLEDLENISKRSNF